MPIAKCLFDTTLYTKVLHLAVGTFLFAWTFRSQYFAWNAASVASPTWPIPVPPEITLFSPDLLLGSAHCEHLADSSDQESPWAGNVLGWLVGTSGTWHLALGWYQQTDPTTLGWQRPWSVSLRSQLSTSDSPLSPPSVGGLCSARGTLCSARCKDTKQGDTDTHHHWGTQRAMRAHFWPQSFSVSGTKRAWVRNQKRSSRRFVDKDISGFFPALGHIRELAHPTATFYILLA